MFCPNSWLEKGGSLKFLGRLKFIFRWKELIVGFSITDHAAFSDVLWILPSGQLITTGKSTVFIRLQLNRMKSWRSSLTAITIPCNTCVSSYMSSNFMDTHSKRLMDVINLAHRIELSCTMIIIKLSVVIYPLQGMISIVWGSYIIWLVGWLLNSLVRHWLVAIGHSVGWLSFVCVNLSRFTLG